MRKSQPESRVGLEREGRPEKVWPPDHMQSIFSSFPSQALFGKTSCTYLGVQSSTFSLQSLSLLSFAFTEIPFSFIEPHFSFENFFFLESPSPFTFHKDCNNPQPSGVLSCRRSLWFPVSLWSSAKTIWFIPRWQPWRPLDQTLVQFCDSPA